MPAEHDNDGDQNLPPRVAESRSLFTAIANMVFGSEVDETLPASPRRKQVAGAVVVVAG